MFPGLLVILAVTAIIAVNASSQAKKGFTPRGFKSPIIEKSHQFHEPIGEYEHDHADRIGRNLIRHEDPEPGYVVLNGKKRRIEDCRNI